MVPSVHSYIQITSHHRTFFYHTTTTVLTSRALDNGLPYKIPRQCGSGAEEVSYTLSKFWAKTRADEIESSNGDGDGDGDSVKIPGLLRLPYELRSKIYNLVFEGAKCTPAYRFAYKPKARQVVPRNFVALLLVCHSTYRETRLLPFTVTTFEFYDAISHYHFVDLLFRYQREAVAHVKMIAEEPSTRQHPNESQGRRMKPENWFKDFRIDQVYEELVDMLPNLRTLTVEQHMINRKSLEDTNRDMRRHLEALPAMFGMHHQTLDAPFASTLRICYCDAEEPAIEGCDHQRTSCFASQGRHLIED